MKSFNVLSSPRQIYRSMLRDIAVAKESVYLETYIYDADKIGKVFRRALLRKAKEGVHVKLLIDAWGSSANKHFFRQLIAAGAEVRYFREFRYVIRIFSKNHERNHRKLLLIDGETSYIGSANITALCLEWRELALRLEGPISKEFARSFMNSWESYGQISKRSVTSLIHKGFEIMAHMPASSRTSVEKRYVRLIKRARKEILIETPFFVPSPLLRQALARAAARGVRVRLILPLRSDTRVIDTVRSRYLGWLYTRGIDIYYYRPGMLHSKLLLVDDRFFLLGSSNVDYRSFMYQYDINLLGTHARIHQALKKYFFETLRNSIPFNYYEWKKRSSFKKIFEMVLMLIRKYL
jgi:cardiolipin synthase A/B